MPIMSEKAKEIIVTDDEPQKEFGRNSVYNKDLNVSDMLSMPSKQFATAMSRLV